MGYALACCIVSGSDIGLLQIDWYGHLCHEQSSVISKVLDDPCIPLIDQGIEEWDILTLGGFVSMIDRAGRTGARRPLWLVVLGYMQQPEKRLLRGLQEL